MKQTELVVMLTHHDKTIENAVSIFDECKNSSATIWGMKEVGLPIDTMIELFSFMKSCGKKTVLEIVEYEKDACLKHLDLVKKCGCDILMGTYFFDEINDFCKENNIKYMPFVGNINYRPSILSGEIDDMITQAQSYIDKGAYGIDLLCYRYDKNPDELLEKFVQNVQAPVCIAGSINSYERLDKLSAVAPWGFTMGSALFDNEFGESIVEQIEKVHAYMHAGNKYA